MTMGIRYGFRKLTGIVKVAFWSEFFGVGEILRISVHSPKLNMKLRQINFDSILRLTRR